MSYLRQSFGPYDALLAIAENDKSKHKLSRQVIDNAKFLLWELQKLDIPVAYRFEPMSDNSVRLEWWKRAKTVEDTRGLYVDVFSEELLLTLVHGVKITKEVHIKLSNRKLVSALTKAIEGVTEPAKLLESSQ